ncbi:DNA replication regulator SLD3-domain-containing protein [Triangularia verruculosa]|uniref:DNA replication regulator SLD3-domain-containing protein n=1 Tax=Triangularia verruculosa TaxID=2587418 RepID=A0AAN7AYE7_9PEZI|nr:DNA replication regulator SLD3-domain-containing protein [Triangularia verruculosa]
MSSAVRPSSGGASLSHSRPNSISTPISLPPLPLSRPASRASAGGGILTPSRDTQLNQPGRRRTTHDQDVFGSKKRKRDVSTPGLGADSLLKAPIVLKPHPSSLTAKPSMLHPLMMLPRESLPLSALDLAKPHGELPSNRLFESKIKILDLEGRLGSSVLIARSEITRMVYAVENESPGLYVVCKLGSWVDMQDLSYDATAVYQERLRSPKQIKVEDTAGAPLITPQMYKENKRRKLAIEELQSVARKRAATLTERDSQSQFSALPDSRPASQGIVDSRPASRGIVDFRPASRGIRGQSILPAEDILDGSLAMFSSTRDNTPAPQPVSDTGNQVQEQGQEQEQAQEQEQENIQGQDQPSAEDLMGNIRTQYQEALYHSKGSLAYFAKGPLSRARAAFHPESDSNLEIADLVEFLKSLVMTTILVDKKYRETVPAIVERMKTRIEDSDNAQKRKKRKPKKPKMGKDGLYPSEVDHVKRWWTSHMPLAVGDEEEEKTVSPSEARYHISCLRRRETQLQMILIMEILALEPLIRPKDPVGDYLLPGESRAPSREASQEPTVKKRNKHNLPVLLDVHADRLCIWQSVTLDEVKALAESQAPKEGQNTERADSDPLKDFCVEIILPFFSARLPELCDSINRKLGGPVAQSPPKKEFAKPAAVAKAKPGAPAKRPAALKRDSDRSLRRALSNERMGRMRRSVSTEPSKAIALLRSASATAIPGLKREGSEPLLMGMIPRSDKSSLREKPTNVFPRGEDHKAKKKAQVDAELKDAISALKKPNRALAVKEFADAVDKRASAGQVKKMRKPRTPSVVKATPANSRFKDVLGGESARGQTSLSFEPIPPSSASMIPASTLPRKFTNALAPPPSSTPIMISATPARKSAAASTVHTLQAIQETPGPILASSPIMARKAAPAPTYTQRASTQFLSIPRGDIDHFPSSPGLPALFETPVNPKFTKLAAAINDSPIRSRLSTLAATQQKEKEKEVAAAVSVGTEIAVKKETSIYAQLGWDDDDDII